MIKPKEKPILTAEAKKLFAFEVKQINPIEALIVHEIIQKSSLSVVDKKFCISHIGRRAERLLRNVALYQDWERTDDEEGEHDDQRKTDYLFRAVNPGNSESQAGHLAARTD